MLRNAHVGIKAGSNAIDENRANQDRYLNRRYPIGEKWSKLISLREKVSYSTCNRSFRLQVARKSSTRMKSRP